MQKFTVYTYFWRVVYIYLGAMSTNVFWTILTSLLILTKFKQLPLESKNNIIGANKVSM